MLIIKINVLIFFSCDLDLNESQTIDKVKSDLLCKKKDIIKLATCKHAHS